MKIVVVTGSTRGIGHGLVDAFLARDCAVVVSGRTEQAVQKAVAILTGTHEADRVFDCPCDGTDFAQVQALWDAAKGHFGRVDIWINNTGIRGPQMDFWKLEPEQIRSVVATNMLGAMYGSKVALHGMLAQGFGALYNMEGMGSDGRKTKGMVLYGTTKSGLCYLNESLAQETRGTKVLAGALSPGMVITDFMTRPYEDRPEDRERVKRIFNILADRVDTVTPWLAEKVLANDKNGVCIAWLGTFKVLSRFLAAPFRKRDLFA
ncbi:MAG: SDR family oxidoreductase [Anaerolineae bacterium]|nr:SDR family oxidoreductase [Anaerolineae bacterium]